MDWIVLLPAAAALAYQAMAIVASLLFHERRRVLYGRPPLSSLPAVSLLKPVRGVDDRLMEALKSHTEQDYPEFEILLGVRSKEDPAWPILEKLAGDHGNSGAVRLIECPTEAANGKVGVLVDLAKEARHPVWLVNDADIIVPPDYVRRVVAHLDRPDTGLVTCLYRADASSWAGRFEALVIATDFIPSTLVAPLVGVREFGLGSTLCFRSGDLKAAGGFEALGDFIADDYELAKRITSGGKRATFAEVIVQTTLSDPEWRDVWRHQLRWARTIRGARPDGFAGLAVTHTGLWALVCIVAGWWPVAITLWLARATAGAIGGFLVLRHWPALILAPLLPLCDLWSFAVWMSAWFKREVWWRGRVYSLLPGGRIARARESGSAEEEMSVPEQEKEAAHRG